MYVLIVIGLVVVGLLVFFKSFKWTAAHCPTPNVTPVIGPIHTFLTRADDINDWMYEQTLELGPVWSFWIPGQPRFTMVCDPQDVEHLLKTNFDNYIKGP
ncbi:MAG: hypothetical protein Q8P67_15300 [archaeon]|nr:hypothetical protein [archaeon]